jgi:Ca2+-binding RTX toxin-like protein
MRRACLGALASLAAIAAIVPAAHAGSLYVTDDGTHRVLHFVADPGEINGLQVAAPDGQTYLRVDDANDLTLGTGCTLFTDATDARCDKAGITEVDVDLGDQDDQFDVVGDIGLPVVANGGDGADQLGAAGHGSRLDGGPGDDTFRADDPRLSGADDAQRGADDFHGDAGHDTISYYNRVVPLTISLDDVANDGYAGEGDDVHSDIEQVRGGFDSDTITGSAGDDELFGSGGDDTLSGLGGDDTLESGNGCGVQALSGGTGDDTLLFAGQAHADGGPDDDTLVPVNDSTCGHDADIQGGAGHDVADLRHVTTTGASFSLDDVADDGATGTDDYHSDIEDMTAAAGANSGLYLIGSAGPNVLTGGSGDDLLQGGGGADTLIGGGGDDVADYSDHSGPVTLTLDGAANDGSPGEGDQIAGDIEDLRGGSGNDTLVGNGGDNILDGGPGADVLSGGAGVDAVDYSDRIAPVHVDLDGSPGNDGGSGEGDTVGADVEGAFGGAGDDTLIGNGADGFLAGGDGNDMLTDPGGDDDLFGEDGDDVIDSTDGAPDLVSCGDGDDQVWRDAIDQHTTDCERVAIGPRTSSSPSDAPRPPTVIRIPVVVARRPPVTPARTLPAPADTTAPTAHVTVVRGARLARLLARGLDVDVLCSENCRIDARLVARSATARTLRRHGVRAGTTLASGRLSRRAGGRVRLRVTKAGRRALAHLRGGVSLQLILVLTDGARNHRQVAQALSLRH